MSWVWVLILAGSLGVAAATGRVGELPGAIAESAGRAVAMSIGLAGVLALWLGLMKVAERAGLVGALGRLARPLLRRLFPDVPADSPAMGAVVMNISANMLGLGNAATPFGIKAMEELQTLNPSQDAATNAQVMLLAINTASVQLVPPVLLVAIMGLQINTLIIPIILTGICGLIIAITAAKLYGRLPGSRRSDPNRQSPPPAPASAGEEV